MRGDNAKEKQKPHGKILSLCLITEKIIEIKLDCRPRWTKQRSDNDYMNNYIKIYRMVQRKEVI